MPAPIQIIGGLPFVAALLHANGKTLRLERILIDTGSAATLFKTDDLVHLDLLPLPADPLRIVRGIGGEEAVIEKRLARLEVGEIVVDQMPVQMGAVDYGIEMDGILGLDFLLRGHSIVDFSRMALSAGPAL